MGAERSDGGTRLSDLNVLDFYGVGNREPGLSQSNQGQTIRATGPTEGWEKSNDETRIKARSDTNAFTKPGFHFEKGYGLKHGLHNEACQALIFR